MNNSRLTAADSAQRGACRTNRGRTDFLGGLLARLLDAPRRLHGYRNLNTRLVRDAFCVRDCGSGGDD